MYVATVFAVSKVESKQTLMLRLQVGDADVVAVVVVVVADEVVVVVVAVVKVVDCEAPVLDETDEVVLAAVVRVVDCEVVLALEDTDVEVVVAPVEAVVDEVLVVVSGLGHVGSLMMTLIGPPRASHTPFSSPALIAAESSSGVILSPRTSLLPIRTEATSGFVSSS